MIIARVKIMRRLLKALEIPFILSIYGLGIILLQPFLIKGLSSDLFFMNRIIKSFIDALLYIVVNGLLIYSWYLLTKKLRNLKLRSK